INDGQIKHVVDQCYQCKLCYPICPYVPPHDWLIDFPRTIMRADLVRAKQTGISLADRLFGDTDLVGTLSSWFAPLVNWTNKNKTLRGLMEKYLGIHRDRLLPTFHAETFAKWFRKRRAQAKLPGDEKLALFYTCTVNYNEPDIGKAAVAVLEKNGIECAVLEQQCCGLPFLDVGQM